MRVVIMLGALALLALSTTAEDQDKALDLAGKDILTREVRGVRRGKKKKGPKPGNRRSFRKKDLRTDKKKGPKPGNRRSFRKKDLRTDKKKAKGKKKGNGGTRGQRKPGSGFRKGKGNGKKEGTKRKETTKGKRNRSQKGGNSGPKGGKSTEEGDNIRQGELDPYDCPAFYNQDDTTAVRDYRYARNQIQKARRAEKRIGKLDKLTEKAATAFLDGAAFYKECDAKGVPGAKALYEGLSQCNNTAAAACNPILLKLEPAYANLTTCIEKLEVTMDSSENCLSKGECGTGSVADGECAYQPIGIVNDPRTCDYIAFDKQVATVLNKACSNSTYVGSFTYCNNLLKDNFDIASSCLSPMPTTVAPSSGRIRKNLNIWKI